MYLYIVNANRRRLIESLCQSKEVNTVFLYIVRNLACISFTTFQGVFVIYTVLQDNRGSKYILKCKIIMGT